MQSADLVVFALNVLYVYEEWKALWENYKESSIASHATMARTKVDAGTRVPSRKLLTELAFIKYSGFRF